MLHALLPRHTVLCCAVLRCVALRSAKAPAVRRLLQSRKYPLSTDPDNKGCYVYRAQSGDTIEQMAKDLGVAEEE